MKRSALRLVAFVLAGAAVGLAYQHFIGCRTGGCPITSNPFLSAAYGALIGYFASGGWSRLQKGAAESRPKPEDSNRVA